MKASGGRSRSFNSLLLNCHLFSKLNPISPKDGNLSSAQSNLGPVSMLAPQTTLPSAALVDKLPLPIY